MAVVSSVPGSRAEGMKVRKASDPPPTAVKTVKELKAEKKTEKKAAKALKKEQKKKNDEKRKEAKKASKNTKKTDGETSKRFTTKNTTNLPMDQRTANPNVKLGQRKESKSKSPLRILGM
ncbi:hypothetical protein EPVG_00436 [Emiliania huxleyi virus 201]|nr:hypothetical protein ELVG_00420 [Emiliania huxleyi virus 203]AEP15804.1 hypothetical protein EQVG_00395 [Emiliania huxleyi virus 207]AEP16193.1 hypothetical protein ERVG_00318 [Emiliania huxleyi virus 208]AET98323.1 hypothetical protein EPVG_00436 [Emiliania huxleyi virus 201]